MTMRHTIWAGAVAALLAACGGGGGGDLGTPAAPAVPDSASRSVAGMVTFLATLAGSAQDTQEPLALTGFAPPRPDDAEALALK